MFPARKVFEFNVVGHDGQVCVLPFSLVRNGDLIELKFNHLQRVILGNQGATPRDLDHTHTSNSVMRLQAILPLLSSTPYVHDYFNIAQGVLNHLGSISPYHRARHYDASQIESELPIDCTIDQVMLVSCNFAV
jgi:hypothetical protein